MIGMNFKQLFADSKAVLSAADRASRKVLGKFGAYVRRTAKQSIRKRKRPALPGSPPSSHTGLLKRHIYFFADAQSRNVVIGPIRLSGRASGGEAPHALEEGGMVSIAGKRKVRIQPRPFMGPAMEKEKPQLPQLWRNSITK